MVVIYYMIFLIHIYNWGRILKTLMHGTLLHILHHNFVFVVCRLLIRYASIDMIPYTSSESPAPSPVIVS